MPSNLMTEEQWFWEYDQAIEQYLAGETSFAEAMQALIGLGHTHTEAANVINQAAK